MSTTRRNFITQLAGGFAAAMAGASLSASESAAPPASAPAIEIPEYLTGQQHALLHCPVAKRAKLIEIAGPRGCGKSWALARWLADLADDPDYRGAYAVSHRWNLQYATECLRRVRSKDFGELTVDRINSSASTVKWPSGATIIVYDSAAHQLLERVWCAVAACSRIAVDGQRPRGVSGHATQALALPANHMPVWTGNAGDGFVSIRYHNLHHATIWFNEHSPGMREVDVRDCKWGPSRDLERIMWRGMEDAPAPMAAHWREPVTGVNAGVWDTPLPPPPEMMPRRQQWGRQQS